MEVTVGRGPIKEINFRMMELKQMSGLRLNGKLFCYNCRIGGFDISLDLVRDLLLAGRLAVLCNDLHVCKATENLL